MRAQSERITMQEYLEATAFAVKRVIEAVWYEGDEFEKSRGFVRQEVDENTWNAFLAASMTGEDDQFWTTYSGLGVSQLSANNALALRAVIHRLSAARSSASAAQASTKCSQLSSRRRCSPRRRFERLDQRLAGHLFQAERGRDRVHDEGVE